MRSFRRLGPGDITVGSGRTGGIRARSAACRANSQAEFRRRGATGRADSLDRVSLQPDLFDEGVGDGVRLAPQPVIQVLLLQGDDRSLNVLPAPFGVERGREPFQRLRRMDSARLFPLVSGNAARNPLRQRPRASRVWSIRWRATWHRCPRPA